MAFNGILWHSMAVFNLITGYHWISLDCVARLSKQLSVRGAFLIETPFKIKESKNPSARPRFEWPGIYLPNPILSHLIDVLCIYSNCMVYGLCMFMHVYAVWFLDMHDGRHNLKKKNLEEKAKERVQQNMEYRLSLLKCTMLGVTTLGSNDS